MEPVNSASQEPELLFFYDQEDKVIQEAANVEEFSLKGASGIFSISENQKDNLKKNQPNLISLSTVRITCASASSLSDKLNYAGLIVYKLGEYDAKKETGRNIFPGWVLIVDSSKLPQATDGSQVHGPLVEYHFKKTIKQMKDLGAVFSGFAIMKGVFKSNSGGLNVEGQYHNSQRELHADEARLVQGAIRIAQTRSQLNGQTMKVADILQYWIKREKQLYNKWWIFRTSFEQQELLSLIQEREDREKRQKHLQN